MCIKISSILFFHCKNKATCINPKDPVSASSCSFLEGMSESFQKKLETSFTATTSNTTLWYRHTCKNDSWCHVAHISPFRRAVDKPPPADMWKTLNPGKLSIEGCICELFLHSNESESFCPGCNMLFGNFFYQGHSVESQLSSGVLWHYDFLWSSF